MVIPKDKEPIYKDRIFDVLKNHGKLPMTRIALLCRMNNYNAHFVLLQMIEDKTVRRINGTITLYDLVEVDNGK